MIGLSDLCKDMRLNHLLLGKLILLTTALITSSSGEGQSGLLVDLGGYLADFCDCGSQVRIVGAL